MSGKEGNVHILLTNDDGITADGLRYLKEAISHMGEVTIVAPERQRSGSSHALTLDNP